MIGQTERLSHQPEGTVLSQDPPAGSEMSEATNPSNPNYGQPRPGVVFREPRSPMASTGYQGGTAQQQPKPREPKDSLQQQSVKQV